MRSAQRIATGFQRTRKPILQTSPSTLGRAKHSSLSIHWASSSRWCHFEVPVLAGIPFCRPGADGRQCRRAQACGQRAGLRAGKIEEGFPRGRPATGYFPHLVMIGSGRVDAVIEHPETIAAVTLTGSEAAGRAVAAARPERVPEEIRPGTRRQRCLDHCA